MRIPIFRGVIDRRILVNYRVEPEAISHVLPPPFELKTVRGFAIAGICLIRLKSLRPRGLPAVAGVSSENAAHRVAVQWEQDGTWREGVYIPRRDTNSWLNVLAGGRMFPGVHHHARFRVEESAQRFSVAMQSDDGHTRVCVMGSVAQPLSSSSVFSSLAAASAFFEAGSQGYSGTQTAGRYDGLELRCRGWNVESLHVDAVESTFFEDREHFPPGSVEFDHALLMRGIEHEWHGREQLCCPSAVAAEC